MYLHHTIQGHRDIYTPSPPPSRSPSPSPTRRRPYVSPRSAAYRHARKTTLARGGNSSDSDAAPGSRRDMEEKKQLADKMRAILQQGRGKAPRPVVEGVVGTLAKDVGELQASLEREISRRLKYVS
jgi:hypothetical protein